MRPLPVPVLLAFASGLVLAGCGGAEAAPPAGRMEAAWEGRDQGSGILEARGLYCQRDSTLQILAHLQDRGIGLALHLASPALAPGEYTLVHPESAVIPRPGATGAYRFLTVEALHGYVSRDGVVELTGVGPEGLSGSLRMTLVAQSGPDSIMVRGTFARVAVDSTYTPCGLAPRTPVEIF